MEVYKNLPEGTLAELIDNVIYMSPSLTKIHQKVLQTIFRRLSEVIDDSHLGEVIIAPFDVYLDDVSNAIQPDIIIILKSNKGSSRLDGHFHGVPDVIFEILSPSNKEFDLVRKKELYERFAVPEYWIIDPQTSETVAYCLQGGQYNKFHEGKNKIDLRQVPLSFSF